MSTWNDVFVRAVTLIIVYGLYLGFLRARTWYYKRCPFVSTKENTIQHLVKKDK